MLKDLPFYEVAHLEDLEAHQVRLEQRGKNVRKECNSGYKPSDLQLHRPTSYQEEEETYCSTRSEGKDFAICISVFPISFIFLFVFIFFNPSTESKTGVELVVPPIACEKEEEKDMVANFRANFKERQHKFLSESIMENPAPSKRPCMEPICLEPVSTLASMSAPSTTIVGIISELDERVPSVEGTTHHELRRPFLGLDHLSDESIECVTSFLSRPKSSHILSREEITELMR